MVAPAIIFEIEPIFLGLSFGENSSSSDRAFLNFSVKCLRKDQQVELSDGTLLSRIAGDVQIRILEKPEPNNHSHISYSPSVIINDTRHPAYYSIYLNLPEADFKNIQRLVCEGNPPKFLTISSHDLKFGNIPGGNEKIWSVDKTTTMIICGFSLGLSLKNSNQDEEEILPVPAEELEFRYKQINNMTDPFYKDAALLVLNGRNDEREKAVKNNYTDKQIRLAIVHAREDLIAISAYISGLYKYFKKSNAKIELMLLTIIILLIVQIFRH